MRCSFGSNRFVGAFGPSARSEYRVPGRSRSLVADQTSLSPFSSGMELATQFGSVSAKTQSSSLDAVADHTRIVPPPSPRAHAQVGGGSRHAL